MLSIPPTELADQLIKFIHKKQTLTCFIWPPIPSGWLYCLVGNSSDLHSVKLLSKYAYVQPKAVFHRVNTHSHFSHKIKRILFMQTFYWPLWILKTFQIPFKWDIKGENWGQPFRNVEFFEFFISSSFFRWKFYWKQIPTKLEKGYTVMSFYANFTFDCE